MPPKKTQPQQGDDREKASTIAVRHVISPDEDSLVEVSNIPVGATHPLTMLLTYRKHLDALLVQVIEMQKWYIRRFLRRKYGNNWLDWQTKYPEVEESEQTEHQKEYYKMVDKYKQLDTVDTKTLFIHKFLMAYCQVSRGKEAKLLEILEVLSDTDLQTRSTDMENAFRNPIRDQ